MRFHNRPSSLRAIILVSLTVAAIPFLLATATVVMRAPNLNPNVRFDPKLQLSARNIPLLQLPPFSLKTFADKLEARLKGKSVGYEFAVSFNGTVLEKRAGGDARRAPDSASRKMTFDDKYNLASVSKTMTAAAALKVLHSKGISVDKPMYKFLPSTFKPGINVQTITFRELLTHYSGIRCDTEVTQTLLEQCVANGINLGDKKQWSYNNNNFALFRFLIPELERYTPPQRAHQASPAPILVQLKLDYPVAYMSYVQKNVFTPAGLPTIACKPTDASPE